RRPRAGARARGPRRHPHRRDRLDPAPAGRGGTHERAHLLAAASGHARRAGAGHAAPGAAPHLHDPRLLLVAGPRAPAARRALGPVGAGLRDPRRERRGPRCAAGVRAGRQPRAAAARSGHPAHPDHRRRGARPMKGLLAMPEGLQDRMFSPAQRERLAEITGIDVSRTVPDLAAAPDEELAEVEVLVTGWGSPAVDAAALARMPHLRAIVHTAG